MSLDLLCPEAQQMARDRSLNLSPGAILQLATMESWRQTGWLNSPVIQSLIDRFMSQALSGVAMPPATGDIQVPVSYISQPIPEPAPRVPTPDPDMPDIPFNLFD